VNPAASEHQPIYSLLAADSALAGIVAQFVSELPDRVSAMKQTFALGEQERLRSQAHQLKGAAGSYGFDVLSQAAERLEALILNRCSVGELATSLKEVCDIVALVRSGRPA